MSFAPQGRANRNGFDPSAIQALIQQMASTKGSMQQLRSQGQGQGPGQAQEFQRRQAEADMMNKRAQAMRAQGQSEEQIRGQLSTPEFAADQERLRKLVGGVGKDNPQGWNRGIPGNMQEIHRNQFQNQGRPAWSQNAGPQGWGRGGNDFRKALNSRIERGPGATPAGGVMGSLGGPQWNQNGFNPGADPGMMRNFQQNQTRNQMFNPANAQNALKGIMGAFAGQLGGRPRGR